MDLTLGYALIALGLLLLAAELFLPSFGVLAILAMACGAIGMVLIFRQDTTLGMITLVLVVILVPIVVAMISNIFVKTPLGQRFVLTAPSDEESSPTLTLQKELDKLRGRYGKTLSVLRPAGVVDFDGRRVDTITEGMMVEIGQWVRCIDIREGRVIVRPVDRAPETLAEPPTESGDRKFDIGGLDT